MHITIAGMGANGEVTEDILKAATAASAVVLQTDISKAFKESGIVYDTLDEIFEQTSDFDALKIDAAERIMRENLLFVTLGDVWRNEIAAELVHRILSTGGSVDIIQGGEPALCLAFAAGTDCSRGAAIYTASSFIRANDTDLVVVINEIDTRLLASELKLKLSRFYDDKHNIYIADIRSKNVKIIPLFMLDGEASYGYYTSIVIPPEKLVRKGRYTFSDLLAVMEILRSENGCPWDKEQTHESLKRYLLEESYEVIEAIDEGDISALYDELGDVLLQVAFHARIGEQCGEFDIGDITTAICAKMISRHSHIFGSDIADTPEEVLRNWEKIKKGEKGQKTQADVLEGVPKSMPALLRSEKIQHKAANAGMDFTDISGAIEKLKEEIVEVEESFNSKGLEEECGDMLFSAVNVARLAGIEPEMALQKAADKFIARFRAAEEIAKYEGIDMQSCGLDKLNYLWNKAKLKKN